MLKGYQNILSLMGYVLMQITTGCDVKNFDECKSKIEKGRMLCEYKIFALFAHEQHQSAKLQLLVLLVYPLP